MATKFEKRPPSFEVGEVFAVKHLGNFFLARVARREGDTAHVHTLPEGGFDEMKFQCKPSSATRAVVSREEAESLLTTLTESGTDVPDRKARFQLMQAAKKSMNPFEKASTVGMLARRSGTDGLNSDDTVAYRQLRGHLQIELAASLQISEEEADQLLSSKGIPNH